MRNTILFIFTLILSLQSFSQVGDGIIWETTIDFENGPMYMELDSSETNLWQIGTPSQTFFDSAYSPITAIVTDTMNNYPVSNYSYFDLILNEDVNPIYPYVIFIEIKHKFDTDSLLDGGFITRSNDEGETWVNIVLDQECYDVTPNYWNFEEGSEGMYGIEDSLYNGELGFSGNSGDWITSWFSWYIYPVAFDGQECMGENMIIRFNFVSDDIEGDFEGWMIDNIRLYAVDLGSSIDEIENTFFSVSPNPSSGQYYIDFKENSSKARMEIYNSKSQLLIEENEIRQNFNIDLSPHPPGIYYAIFTNDQGQRFTEKLILE
ncbi:MAG: hypothetical protein ACI8XB_000236 [Patiriisocius sp.]|jgi:hypothetical protein